MKKYIYYLMSLIFISGFLFSCSTSVDVAKRRYNSGFYVDISSKKHASAPTKVKEVKAEQEVSKVTEQEQPTAMEVAAPSSSLVPQTVVEKSDAVASSQKIIGKASAIRVTSESNKSTVAAPQKVNVNTAMAYYKNSRGDVKDKKAAKSTKSGSGKSWTAALLLCIFLGGIGIHRFYLGYTWQGIVQVLTLGGCGVWALIDLIRIITKDLKPKDGDYN